MPLPPPIEGTGFSDERGKLLFFNSFDMREIVRFYEIAPADTLTVRAWQAHKDEKKWFYCLRGSFTVHLIKPDNLNNPSKIIGSEKFILDAEKPRILKIPGGYANGFKGMEEGSTLMVFSNFYLDESKEDDFRYPIEQWDVDWG